jgi:hypothetical protein
MWFCNDWYMYFWFRYSDQGISGVEENEQPSHFNETDETGEIEFICEPIWVCSFC